MPAAVGRLGRGLHLHPRVAPLECLFHLLAAIHVLLKPIAALSRMVAVVGAKDAWIERSIFVLDDLEFMYVITN